MLSDTSGFSASITVPSRIESIRLAAAFLVHAAQTAKVPVADNPLYEVAIVEALNNAFKHNDRAEGSIVCEFELSGRRLAIRVLDDGALSPVVLAMAPGPIAVPELPTDNWEAIPESGYGLHLIQAIFPELQPVTRDGRHGVEMAVTF